jgi:hypothetical protein
MRDNFSEKTKNILASRVAFRCSFPGCSRITIGPGSGDSQQVISVGEAAHIYSAAPNGPRNNPSLTPEQRASVENGIWMCKTHARLIDVDETVYSADTLLKWKVDAENGVRERLETLEKEVVPTPLTLIMLDINLILRCRWIYVHEETWKFRVYEFVEGDITKLNEHISKVSSKPDWDRYVVVESQGDGRVLKSASLELDTEGYVLCCDLNPKLPRTSPHDVGGDLAMADDGDLLIANGDFATVHGIDCAIKIIRTNLCWEFGWWANPHIGTHFKSIYHKYHQAEDLLNGIVKLEIARLLTVPAAKGLFDEKEGGAELSFINRINWVKVTPYDEAQPFLPIFVSLEWGNHETWEGELKIPFGLNDPEDKGDDEFTTMIQSLLPELRQRRGE